MRELLTSTINKFKSQADYIEIRVEEGNLFSLSFQGPLLDNISRSTNLNGSVRAIKEGIYAIRMLGGQTNGELFTFSSGEAFMIRNGKIAEPVSDVTLTRNVFWSKWSAHKNKKCFSRRKVKKGYNQFL